MFNVFYHSSLIYKLSPLYRLEKKLFNGFRSVSRRIITNAEKNILPRSKLPPGADKNDLKKPCIFVEQVYKMFSNMPGFTDTMLKDHIDTIIAAGNETSGLTTCFTVLMLAIHQDTQERVVEELRSIFKSADQEVTFEDIANLKYLTMVLNETLRLFPITPFIGREVTKDFELEPNLLLPKGATIIMPIFKIHRNKEVWGPNADVFDPDNFLPENVERRHPYSYIPFSNGPRNCIGMACNFYCLQFLLKFLIFFFYFKE